MSERQPTSWRDGLPIHAAAESFPLLPPDELRAILKHGLTSPIVLWRPDPKGQALLLDGRGRLDAIEMVVGAPVVVGRRRPAEYHGGGQKPLRAEQGRCSR